MPNNFINQFPYSDFHEMNLDWIIKEVKRVSDEMHEFTITNQITCADPISWNITTQYPGATIVYDDSTGRLMISKKPVPAGVSIDNEEFWTLALPFSIDDFFSNTSINPVTNRKVTGKFAEVDENIADLNAEDQALSDRITSDYQELNDSISNTNNNLTEETSARISADNSLSSRIDTNATDIFNEITARRESDNVINRRIDNIVSLPEGSTQGDAELMDIRVGANGVTYPNAGDAVRGQYLEAMGYIDDLNANRFNYIDDFYHEPVSLTAGTTFSNNTKIFDESIEEGKYFIFKIVDDSEVLDSSAVGLYYWDSEDNITNILNNISPNEVYLAKAPIDIKGLSAYIVGTKILNTGTVTFQLTVINSSNNISADDIVSGGFTTEGLPRNVQAYSRIQTPFVCKRGTIIKSQYVMDAFEYDLITGAFIRANNGWTNSYTVQNDCLILMYWNRPYTDAEAIASSTNLIYSQTTLAETSIPNNTIREISRYANKRYIKSHTARSIAHRGNYTCCRGMEDGASAVIAAKAYGYEATENDVQVTADGVMVCWHDTTLASIGDPTHSISDYTLAELKAMDFGSAFGSQFAGETILTVEEWLTLCKELGMYAYIDFKVVDDDFTDALAEELTDIVKYLGMKKYVTYLNNFDKIRAIVPDARLAILNTPSDELIEYYTPYLETGEVVFDGNATELNATNAAKVIDAGFGLECYFVQFSAAGYYSEAAILNKILALLDLGVTGITLDTYRIEDAIFYKYKGVI